MSRMITFLCIAPGHASNRPDRGSQILTIHAGKWAACPAGHDDGHIWEQTSGLDYEVLFRSHAWRPEPDRGALAREAERPL